MAISEDVAKLILEVEDGSFKQQLGRDAEIVGALTEAMARGEIAGQTYDAMLQKIGQTSQQVAGSLDGEGGGGRGGGGGGKLAGAAQAASYAFQDFMSTSGDLGQKLNSITNNIPALLTGLGSLGTGIGLLVTAGVALYRNWDELTVGAEEMERRHKAAAEAIKEETAALEALNKVQTEAEGKAKAARVAGVAEAIAPDKEQIRKALAEDIRRDLEADRQRLTAEIFGQLPPERRDFAALMADPRFARVWRRIGQEQREADVIMGRAIEGGAPELGRLQQLFGPETMIGARLAEAGPERQQQRAEEARDVAQQRESAKLEAQIAQEQARVRDANAKAMGQAFQDEEQDLKRQAQEDKAARAAKTRADHEAARAAQHAATVRQRQVAEEVQVAEQRFGKTAELMAEQGRAGGMSEAQIRRELARRLGQEGVGPAAAAEMATKATNAAMGRLTDMGGRNSELLRLNTEMTRQMAERMRQQEHALQQAWRNLQAANQTNRKTGN